MSGFARAGEVLRSAHEDGAFPAACAEVGCRDAVFWREAVGRLTWDRDSAPTTTDTIFDLASLTKVISTATLAMRAMDDAEAKVLAAQPKKLPLVR